MSQSVLPQSIKELQHLLWTAADSDYPVYVYREGPQDGVTIDLSKLNEIIEIDPANLVATVEPGVKLGALAKKLEEKRLRFIPADTLFYQDKTVGELFYEGCSTISSLKYGCTKHFLMGSEVVLPSGEILKTGGKTVKNVTGYDFTRFFNAPYTDFGITAKYLLKLLPLPETRKAVSVTFKGIAELLAFIKDLKASHIVPAYLLWVDLGEQSVFRTDSSGQLVMMEFDGLSEEVSEQWKNTEIFIKKYKGAICEVSDGCSEMASKWSCLYRSTDKYVLTEEIKMPFTAQGEFYKIFYEKAKTSRVKASLFGQLAEGKLNIVFAETYPQDMFIENIIEAVEPAGGVSSGKYGRLTGKRPAGILAELEHRAKTALDPKRILNR